MSTVVLDTAAFRARYPEFAKVSDTGLPFLFAQATDYLDNSNFSLVLDPVKRERLLYLLMAHIAYITYGDAQGNGGSGLVGHLASATEGSVSATADLGQTEFRDVWYTQSPYGLMFWQATKLCRMAQYYPGGPMHA